jgi:peptidylprolyl isomerase
MDAACTRRLPAVPSLRALLAFLLAVVLLGAQACGGGDSEGSGTPEPQASLGSGDIDDVEVGGATDLEAKPAIKVPDALPPAELQKKDLVKGDGPRARRGDEVSVQYVGVAWSSGQEFDASWDRGEPFSFRLGAGEVIPGWDEGVAGMRVGGRRLLVIPADKGYGEQGSSGIAPNETLVFVVDLKRVKR